MRHERRAETKERKADTTVNEDQSKLERKITEIRKKEMKKVSLRIDKRTVIMVDPKNKTKEYAEQYKKILDRERKIYTYSPKEKR